MISELDPATSKFFEQLKQNRAEWRDLALVGQAAMERLVEVMRVKTGQSFKVRELLYSLWNGKPAQLNQLLCLDWNIRRDVLSVMAGFGFEDRKLGVSESFFYTELEAPIKEAGLFAWFVQEGKNVDKLAEYVQVGRGAE